MCQEERMTDSTKAPTEKRISVSELNCYGIDPETGESFKVSADEVDVMYSQVRIQADRIAVLKVKNAALVEALRALVIGNDIAYDRKLTMET